MFLAFTRDGDQMRARILEHVVADPGVTKNELGKLLGVAWYTVDHHVARLEKRRAVHVDRGAWSHELYPTDLPPAHRPWLRALHSTDKARILELMLLHGDLGVYELSDRLGVTRRIVRTCLHGLMEDGIVIKRGEARPRYRLSSPPLELSSRFNETPLPDRRSNQGDD